MPTKANRAIGSLDFNDVERRKLAIKSRTWSCETCGLIKNLLKEPESQKPEEVSDVDQQQQQQQQLSLHSREELNRQEETSNGLQIMPDRRRFSPPSMLKSICIVLSLLLLRRFVMVLQSA